MSAAAPRVAQEAPNGRRLGIALGALTLAVALLVGGTIVRQAGMLSATQQATVTSVGGYTGIPYTPTRQLQSVGGYTGIPYTPTRQLQSVGGYTGIPYTPTRQLQSVGGYTGIPYTPTRQLQSVGGYTGIPYTPTPQVEPRWPGQAPRTACAFRGDQDVCGPWPPTSIRQPETPSHVVMASRLAFLPAAVMFATDHRTRIEGDPSSSRWIRVRRLPCPRSCCSITPRG